MTYEILSSPLISQYIDSFFIYHWLDYIKSDQRFSNQPLIQHSDFVLTEEKRDDLIADEVLFNRDDLELVKEVGEGNFGIVFEGRLKTHMMNSPMKVAVKRLKPPRRKLEHSSEFSSS